MSVTGGSTPPLGLVNEPRLYLVNEALRNRTPTPQLDDHVEASSKELCAQIKGQRWGLESREQEEQKRREYIQSLKHIQSLEYYRSLLSWKLEVFGEHFSSAELPQLLQATDKLDKMASDAGLAVYDVENVPFGVPMTNRSFWEIEHGFWQWLIQDRQQFLQSQRKARQPASTHTSSSSKQPPVLTPHPRNRRPPSSKGGLAVNARVQKSRFKKNDSPKRRPMTRATASASKKQQSLSATEGESGSAPPPKATWSRQTIKRKPKGERRRAEQKTTTGKPHTSMGVRRMSEDKPTGRYQFRPKSAHAA